MAGYYIIEVNIHGVVHNLYHRQGEQIGCGKPHSMFLNTTKEHSWSEKNINDMLVGIFNLVMFNLNYLFLILIARPH